MRTFVFSLFILSAVVSPATGQTTSELLDRLTALMETPAISQPAQCNEEDVQFERVELNGDTLRLVKDIHYKGGGSRTELRYELPLNQMSIVRFKIYSEKCSSRLTLYSRDQKRSFTRERTQYLNYQLQEREYITVEEVHIRVYKNSGEQILNTLFDLARSLQTDDQ